MMVKALIIEQLESDGTLRTLRMQPAGHDIVVAFAAQYDEPRTGPFHFLAEADELRFREGFANCRSRRLNYPNFSAEGDSFHFETNWYGIPAEPYVLSYYALSLPEFAIPTSVSVSDPHRVGHEYHRYVTRDHDRNRYVIYVECASPQSRFDFDLACDFAINPIAFSTSAYQDTYSSAHSYQRDDWKYFLHGPEREKVQNFFIGGVHTSDTYLVGQAGAVGPYAQSSSSTFHQIRQEGAAVVDKPLTPNLVHPYPLQANFTGRVEERKELTAWLNDAEHPIYQLVAMGGMGKSALTWYWLTKDVLAATDLNLDGVMWWSFYEGESSFAAFVDEALKYVSSKPIDGTRFPATYDRALELRKQLQIKRVLIVLDGFERQLRDYASPDAAFKSEKASDRAREARGCVDLNAARLLRDLAAGTTRAKVLLTTRLSVSDIEDRAGAALAAVFSRELKQLERDDAVEFMRAQGVAKGTTAELALACGVYGNHPLSLRLLSGLIARDARNPGDIAAAPRHNVQDDLIQRQHHVLELSYYALKKRQRALISRIAAFRGPMDFAALQIFENPGEKARFEAALDDLCGRGLLLRDTRHERYDLHPVVRHYCYARLANKQAVHTRLARYFHEITPPVQNKPLAIEDLAPLIELYHHTVRAGRYDEGWTLYHSRMLQPLYYQFAVYQTCVELLSELFPGGLENLNGRKYLPYEPRVLNSIANSYGRLGKLPTSIHIFQLAIDVSEKLEMRINLPLLLANMSEGQFELGQLAEAHENLLRSLALSSEIQNSFFEAVGHDGLGRLLSVCGAGNEGNAELHAAQLTFDQLTSTSYVAFVRCSKAQGALLIGDAKTALDEALLSRTLADEYAKKKLPVQTDFIRTEWLLGAALTMQGEELQAAFSHLTNALTQCRRINVVELEVEVLLSLARWHRLKINEQEAQSHANEALEIANRCEYRLKQAGIHNFLAQLALDAGDRTRAKHHAEIAKERAWCDGPPFSYKPALDQADAMLRELESA